MKLQFRDYLIIFLAFGWIVSMIALLGLKNRGDELLRQEINIHKKGLEVLRQERELMANEIDTLLHMRMTSLQQIDSLQNEIDNQEPIIKYIKIKLKDEEEKPIIMPSPSKLDSVFNSQLQSR